MGMCRHEIKENCNKLSYAKLTLSIKFKNVRESEITIATRSSDRAQPIMVQVFFEHRTFLSFLTFLNLEYNQY